MVDDDWWWNALLRGEMDWFLSSRYNDVDEWMNEWMNEWTIYDWDVK